MGERPLLTYSRRSERPLPGGSLVRFHHGAKKDPPDEMA
jgi:hypothetical protein